MSVEFCGLRLAHPVDQRLGHLRRDRGAAGLRRGARRAFPFAAYVSKTITLEPRAGNPPPRLWETPGGLVNSIGLPNKGLAGYLAEDLPQIAGLRGDPLASADGISRPVPRHHERDGLDRRGAGAARRGLRASRAADRRDRAKRLLPERPHRARHRRRPGQLERVVAGLRDRTAKPLIVKLTPNAADVPACAQAAEAGGGGRRLADQHPARDGALAGPRRGGAMARRRHRRAVRARDPAGRAGPGRRRRGAGAESPLSEWAAFRAPPTHAICSTWGPRSSPSAPRASAIPRRARESPLGLLVSLREKPLQTLGGPSSNLDPSRPQPEVQVNSALFSCATLAGV